MGFINKILSDDINPYKFSIWTFIIVFIAEMLLDLLIGVSMGRFYLGDSNVGEKLTINEIPGRLPHYFVSSILISIVGFIAINETQKSKRRNKYNR